MIFLQQLYPNQGQDQLIKTAFSRSRSQHAPPKILDGTIG